MALPDWLEEELDNCPCAGGGIHTWLFNMARNLHWHYPDKEKLADLLAKKSRGCGREVPRREIEAAINDSEQLAWRPGGSTQCPKEGEDDQPRLNRPLRRDYYQESDACGLGLHRIELDLPRLEQIVLNGKRVADLPRLSPFSMVEGKRMTRLVLAGLFGPQSEYALLCCGQSQSDFETHAFRDWVKDQKDLLSTMSFIVPNPMRDLWGITKDGRMSAHTLDNTGRRRFLVVEMDFGLVERDGKTPKPSAAFVRKMQAQNISIADISAAVLMHLSEYAPLSLVVSSGGKSLHGWFCCRGAWEPEREEEAKLLNFFRYAISLGADWRMWLRSQFARMPDGTRDNGKRQEILYFDPRPVYEFHCQAGLSPGQELRNLVSYCKQQE